MSFSLTVRPSINIFTCKQHHIKAIPRTDSKLATKVDLPYQKTTINFHDDWPVGSSDHPSNLVLVRDISRSICFNPNQIWDTGCSRDPQPDYDISIPICSPRELASHRWWYSNGAQAPFDSRYGQLDTNDRVHLASSSNHIEKRQSTRTCKVQGEVKFCLYYYCSCTYI